MSAVIQNEYTQTDTTTVLRSFTFPYLKTSDIKVSLDGVETTAFTLANATTIQFNTAPDNGAKIKIFRETSVDNLTATFYAGSAIKSEDLNDNFTQNLYKTQEVGARALNTLGGTMTGNLTLDTQADLVFEGATADAHETTIKVVDPTADRTITFPNVTGTVVTTGDTGTVATGMIAGDAVNGDKIADNAINSEHYTDGSIDRVHLAADIVDGTKIADDSINSEHYVDLSIDTQHIANGQITSAKMAFETIETDDISANAITNAKIANDAVTMAKIANSAVGTNQLADNSVTQAKMADDSVGTAELVDSSVDTARLADNSVTLAKMTDNSVGTSELVDSAVTTAKIANDAITNAKIADGVVGTDKLANDAVTNAKIANAQVGTDKLASNSVTTAKIANDAVTHTKIADDTIVTGNLADDAVTNAKIAANAVDSNEIGNGVIDTVHIGAAQVTTAKIADSGVTTAKITDANVTTAKIANDAITIGKIGCEQTTLSDSDSHIPTSGAVVDYVAAQIAPLGGLEVIATELAFPNTQPSSGVVISISDAAGVAVTGTSSNTGRTVGGSTVTINNFPSSLTGETLATGVGLMVSSTGSGQVYNYHKILAAETDVKQLSDDINDFNARYRVGSSNPTSALDSGDLFFNTGTGKLLVYNGTNSAWEEAQSIGNFFISTFSEAFDGSRTQFTLSNAPTNVQQIILSLNGVIQKPGTAFTLSGSTVTLASAPASGTDYFAVVMGSTVNIGTPSNNTVSTAVLQDDSVTTAKIAASNVTATELGANAVITSKIADDAVTMAKIANDAVGANQLANTSVTAASYGSSTSIPSITVDAQGRITAASGNTVNTDLVGDTSPQLGGNLESNGNDIVFNDGDKARFGNSNDLQIYHTGGSDSFIKSITSGSNLQIVSANEVQIKVAETENAVECNANGSVEIFHNNSKKFETASGGIIVTDQDTTSSVRLDNTSGTAGYLYGSSNTDFGLLDGQGHWLVKGVKDNKVELRYDNSVKVETTSAGVKLLGSGTDAIEMTGDVWFNNNEHAGADIYFNSGSKHLIFEDNVIAKFGGGGDLQVYHDGNNHVVSSNGNMNIGCSNNESIYIKTNNTNRWRFWYDGHFRPSADNTYDIGSTTARVRNIYTGDLHLSNKDSSNDVDGTWGNWTIQEGESDLFLKNNRSGKKYKFNLTEVS